MAEQGASPAAASPLLLRLVLSMAHPRSLAAARCVSRAWQEAARDEQVRRASFVAHWGLARVSGTPRQPAFLEAATLASFAHRVPVSRHDSTSGIAVRWRCGLAQLKQMNALMSEVSLHSRPHVFVPVAGTEQLAGAHVVFAYDPLSCRDFAVLQAPRQPGQGGAGAADADAEQEQQQQHQHAPRAAGGARSSRLQIEALQAKLCEALGRSLRIDNATAQFYLDEHPGDLKAAMEAFRRDAEWESSAGRAGPIRTVPVQRWIRGEAGL